MIQFDNIYQDKTVLVTGHTGFKGSWLALWLTKLGARVVGYSRDIPTQPNHFEILKLPIEDLRGDVTCLERISAVIGEYQPDIIFHLAAQPLVRLSYREPLETFRTNTLGTAVLLEAVRLSGRVKAVVNVTTDKCYENREWVWGYREHDRLGGEDPYSASKACSEMVTAAYRASFFKPDLLRNGYCTLLATARAGNVIGGGDWACDRIVPDLMRAVADGREAVIRNPRSVRPWQHVLEPLSGYLLLGKGLLSGRDDLAQAWNFGPQTDAGLEVGRLVELFLQHMPGLKVRMGSGGVEPPEAKQLRLDCSRANLLLGWSPVWDASAAVAATAAWYEEFFEGRLNSERDLEAYWRAALEKDVGWIKESR